MRITRIKFKSFLVSLLGVLTADINFSNGQQNGSYDHRHCYNITGEEICYFLVANGESNWNTARGKCQSKNSSSLPIIRNIDEQRAIEEYLTQLKSEEPSIIDVWTSGKRKIYNDWTWINNNQTLNTTVTINSKSNPAVETHMAISKEWQNARAENRLKTINPVLPAWYLCQYKDRQCNGQQQHEVNATNGCLIPCENGNVSWYEARNECLLNGGDLAVFTYQDQEILKNHKFPKQQYWIGLRKADWVWITSNISKASPEEEEVKYNKWARQAMPTEIDSCIIILANDGQWRASNCNNTKHSVVCEKRVPTRIDSNTTKSTTTTMVENNASSLTVIAAVGAGAAIVILCIIVLLVVICRKSKSSNNKKEPAQTDSETTKDMKTKEKETYKTTEERSIYADIPLAENTANDRVEGGQKGTVYASLDFKQGVTYAEPSTGKLYANTQNVAGPIYAEPLDATGNGTTSAGSSPAVKIGPMGDVYALPTTNVTPSSAKTTERPIYANT